MIFLFKDQSFKVLDPFMEDRKLAKKFRKDMMNLEAIMVECSTSCHSDVYTIIRAKNFKTSFKPFDITYTIAFIESDDDPIDETQALTRTLHIETISDFYNASALIYQMYYADNVGDLLSIGERRVLMSACSIEFKGETIRWDPSKETVIQFINRQDMICDTDEFLDASLPRNDINFDEDEYIMRYDRKSGMRNMQYYHHDRKYFLYMNNGRWKLTPERPSRMLHVIDNESIHAYGMCMNKTGLLYLASDIIAVELDCANSVSIEVTNGKWINENRIWICTDELTRLTYEGYNLADILYMGLYLPQIWDIERFLFDVNPVKINCEFIEDRFYAKTGEYEVPRHAADRGLELDLFAIFSVILSRESQSISFDD